MDAPASARLLLASCLEAGRLHIGQILLGRDFTLRHAGDAGREDLRRYSSPSDAREIARYDEQGAFRPLKSAPNLRRGWILEARTLEGMELALDYFYPAALGLWLSFMRGALQPTPLRETLDRQTGMYRIARELSDDQALALTARRCASEDGCLRSVLWELAPGRPVTSLPASKLSLESLPPDRIPLLCREPCNLLVAAARSIAKGTPSQED